MSLSGKLWPLHLKPQKDELLSSWLVRLARAHKVKPHTFCSFAWPNRSIWNRDIDKSADDDILRLLSERTATPYECAIETALKTYEGRLYEKHNPYGNTPWIMPLGVYHRTRRLYGLQYCPACLAEDNQPYFRRKWRLAFMTVCEKHCVLLLDRCPKCEKPVNFHRNPLDRPITLCCFCKFDLRKARSDGDDYFTQLHSELVLLNALERGWILLPGGKPIYSFFYFSVLHQIMRIVAMNAKAKMLRKLVRRTTAVCTSRVGITRYQKLSIERMTIPARFGLLTWASWLLTDWPYRFVYLCKSSGITSSLLVKDMSYIPHWYSKPIQDNLYDPNRCPSDEEILSGIAYLRKSNMPVRPQIISRILGVREVFRKRKKSLQDYILCFKKVA